MSWGWIRTRIGRFSLDALWSVAQGEVLVLFGPSGAGKTQTLRAIAGLSHPDEGCIAIGGRVAFDSASGAWVPPHQRRVGYVPQDYGLFPHLSVEENIAFGPRWGQESANGPGVRPLLEAFQLAQYAKARPHQLSGGQRQRVAIARALATEPQLLLLDEPFSALDADLRRSLRAEFRRLLMARGTPVILVTHDREDALALGDKVVVLDSGRVVLEGPPLQVLGQPPTALMARLVGVENLYEGRVISKAPIEGVMVCRVGQVDLEAPLTDVGEGDAITIGLRSRDVLLATQRPEGISARNVLPGRIMSLESRSPGVQVEVDCGGLRVFSQVTQEAVQQLSLEVGNPVWVIIKASSLFLVASGLQEGKQPA